MKTDRYTRLLLTVIAVCLLALTFHTLELFSTARAETTAEPSLGFVKVPINEDGSITVRLAPQEVIKVEITDVNTTDNLNVNVNEVGGYRIWDKIPVEVEE